MNTMQATKKFHPGGVLRRYTVPERDRISALAKLLTMTLTRDGATKAIQLISFALGKAAQPRHGQLPQDVVFGAHDARCKILLLIDLYHPLSGFAFRAFADLVDHFDVRASLTVRFVDSFRLAKSESGPATSDSGARCRSSGVVQDNSDTLVYVQKSLAPRHLLALAALGEKGRVRSALDDWFAAGEKSAGVVLRWLSRYSVDPRLVVLASTALRAHELWARAHSITRAPVVLVNSRRLL